MLLCACAKNTENTSAGKGMLPHGASTKNAGFACFGSISEILMT
jgi:hypothetical protein